MCKTLRKLILVRFFLIEGGGCLVGASMFGMPSSRGIWISLARKRISSWMDLVVLRMERMERMGDVVMM
jgi:hypothetical protein